jgi:hypothetical protein
MKILITGKSGYIARSIHSYLYSKYDVTIVGRQDFDLTDQYETLNLGLGLRHNSRDLESIIFLVGFNFNKLRISYSYDLNTSGIKSYTGGSHEVSMTINFECRKTKKSFRALACPSF